MNRLLLKIRNLLKRRESYRYQRYRSPVTPTNKFAELVKKNKELLYENGVPLKKIRFVGLPNFTYDIERNIVNPQYDVYLPVNKETGLLEEKAPVIELTKRPITHVCVDNYRKEDNYEFLKELVANTKRGVVILLMENYELYSTFGQSQGTVDFGVNTEILRLYNLDEIEEMELVEAKIV